MANNICGRTFNLRVCICRGVGLASDLEHTQIVFTISKNYNLFIAELIPQCGDAAALAAIAVMNIHPAQVLVLKRLAGIRHQDFLISDHVDN